MGNYPWRRTNHKLANSMKMWKGNGNTTTLLFSLKGLEIVHQERRGQVKTIVMEHFHKYGPANKQHSLTMSRNVHRVDLLTSVQNCISGDVLYTGLLLRQNFVFGNDTAETRACCYSQTLHLIIAACFPRKQEICCSSSNWNSQIKIISTRK